MFNTHEMEKARKIKGLTKTGLALAAGIAPTTYSRILRTNQHHPPTIKRIAEVLGLSMKDIYIDDDEAAQEQAELR